MHGWKQETIKEHYANTVSTQWLHGQSGRFTTDNIMVPTFWKNPGTVNKL